MSPSSARAPVAPVRGLPPPAARRRAGVPLLALVALTIVLLCTAGAALAVAPPGGAGTVPGGALAADYDKPDPSAVRDLRRGVMPGEPVAGAAHAARAAGARLDKVLTVLVEFAGTDTVGGRLVHRSAARPDPAAGGRRQHDLLDRGLLAQHYRDMLFGTAPGARSMYTYFLEQSGGSYTVGGEVYGWVKVPHAEAYYGAAQGARVPELVADAVRRSATRSRGPSTTRTTTAWWTTCSSCTPATRCREAGPSGRTPPRCGRRCRPATPGVVLGSYTIQPENGTIGVFCHEFGHGLGLPDLYDTVYSGRGQHRLLDADEHGLVGGGQGPGARHRARQPGAVGAGAARLGRSRSWSIARAAQEAHQAGPRRPRRRAPGPSASICLTTRGRAASPCRTAAAQAWWSGTGDLMTTTLTRDVTLPAGAVLTFWTWYDIEPGYDYGYVEVQRAGSGDWQTVKGSITTDDDPYLANEGNGITGPSCGRPATWTAGCRPRSTSRRSRGPSSCASAT